MTESNQPAHPSAPRVVPRWECRTFGPPHRLSDLAGLEPVRETPPVESDETYVLSLLSDASVKVRDGLMDTKTLQRVDGSGLQLWVPTMKAAFPLDASAMATLCAALGVPVPTGPGRPAEWSVNALLAGLVEPRPDLRAVAVHKSRHRSVMDGCMVELTELTVGADRLETVALESPDRALVLRTVGRLGLEDRVNTCVAKGLKSLLGWHPSRYAVADVGTNSVKFVVGERRRGDVASVTLDTAVVTRLGEGLADSGELSQTAVDRTVEALAGLVEDARRDGPVDIVAVGTAGLRQATNRDAFVQAVHARCGVGVEVISGAEEARLAYLAAVSSLPLSGDRLLVFDSGGGSSQFTFGAPDRIDEQFSVDVGAVRFTERFGLAGAVRRDAVEAALAGIAAELAELGGRPRPDAVVAIGGTSTNLAAVAHGLTHYDPEVVHGTVVDLREVDRQIETYRRLGAEERRAVPGLQPARAEVILAGVCIVRTILTLVGQDAVVVSDRGLRHGVVAERFGAASRPLARQS